MTCVFECFQSNCHILKKLHEFLCIMGAFFGEYNFIINFVGYGLMTKSHGVRCTFEEVGGESKMSKDECEF